MATTGGNRAGGELEAVLHRVDGIAAADDRIRMVAQATREIFLLRLKAGVR
jgi:hypothetical protein